MSLRVAAVAGLLGGCSRLCATPGTHRHEAYEQVRHSEKCVFVNATVAWAWFKCPSPFGEPRGPVVGRERRGH